MLLAQRGVLLLWVPVCLSIGIGLWFSLTIEPGWRDYALCLGAALLALWLGWRSSEAVSPVFWAVALVLIGGLLAGTRAHMVGEPVLGFRYYGPIQGRVVGMDRSVSDKMRLTLDQVVLERMAPGRTPARVRVSLHGDQSFLEPAPGMVVILTGHLSPPSGPVEPHGFDFQRKAWFEGLGAVGYTRTPVLALAPSQGRLSGAIFALRMSISQAVQARVPGDAGAFAAAILTGDRSGMRREVLNDLRASNLAHLLAISGLHMGLLTGVVFTVLRFVLALVPWVNLRWSGKKIAAAGAILAGAAYLGISGGNVSTERAFIMVTVMLSAVLVNRRAISLRAVAIAATIVLLRRPEELFGPGFQMSFSATIALVVVFGGLRDGVQDREQNGAGPVAWLWGKLPKWLRPVVAVVLSSAVAGLATAPFAAAHFNRIADYGLVANLLSVPLMGALVMPAAVATAVLWTLGLSSLGLSAMRWGLEWILLVADRVAGLQGAVTFVSAPGPWVVPSLALGAVFWILWRGRARALGAIGIALSVALWVTTVRPDVLISDTGAMLGVMGPEGRALSKPKGDGFSSMSWLENDGDGADQPTAAARPGLERGKGEAVATLPGLTLRQMFGRNLQERADGACTEGLLVVNKVLDPRPTGGCELIDPESLRQTGAIGLWLQEDGSLRRVTTRQTSGDRLWNSAAIRRRQAAQIPFFLK